MKTVCLLPKAKLDISQCYQHNCAVLTKKSQRQIEYWCHNTGESEAASSCVCVRAQDGRAGSHTGFNFLLLGQNACQLTHVMLLLHKDFYIYDATNYTVFNKAKNLCSWILLIRQKTTWSTSHVGSSSSGICGRCRDLSLYSISALTSLNHSQMLINTFPYFYPCVDASWAGKRVCFGCSQYIPARVALSRFS